MKFSLLLSAALSLATISSISSTTVQASSFNEQEVDRNQFAVIAAPYRHGYNLVVVEQLPGQRKCWTEMGTSPTVIEPLFLNFDFTNACKRSSDSNSYSIRFNGQDYGMDYLTDIVKKDGELHLVGVPRDPSKPQLNIGRTDGLSSGSLKIILNPEWRLTKRVYGNNITDHIYLSSNSSESEFVSHGVKLDSSSTQPHEPSSQVTSQEQPTDRNFDARMQMPSYPQPIYSQPVYQQPVYPQYVYQQPVYPQPMYQQPVPIAPQPANNMYRQPVQPVRPNRQQ